MSHKEKQYYFALVKRGQKSYFRMKTKPFCRLLRNIVTLLQINGNIITMTRLLLHIFILFAAFHGLKAQGISLQNAQQKGVIYYKKPGSVVLHLGNQMFNRMVSSSMPVVINPEVTVIPNLTAGPMFGYFKFLNNVTISNSVTMFENIDVWYNHFFIGARVNYHITDLVEHISGKEIGKDYFDLYVSSWLGYSFSTSDHQLAKAEVIQATQKLRGGVLVGVRSMIVPRFGLFLEAGYASYGLGAFGCTVRFDNPKKSKSSFSSHQRKHSLYHAIAEFNH
jgi:hypothetical protein